MKDKRNYLKLACVFEAIYGFCMIIYYLFFTKINKDMIMSLIFIIIGLIFMLTLYKESKKNIEIIKKEKVKILIPSIWLFIEPIIPGILGFIFLSSLKERKKDGLPVIKEYDKKKIDYLKPIILFTLFIIIMFIMPKFNLLNKIPKYIIYIFIILLILLLYFKELKNNFILFIKNIKVYFPFIIKRYFIMLGLMIFIAVPISLINKGNISSNQILINEMFKKVPILTLLLSTLYAPFAEECIFRLSVSKLINNKTLFIIISGFLFGLLHLIDKFTSIGDLLYIFVYATLGMNLAKAYIDSKNIFVPIGMHFIQNLLAGVLVLLLH